MNRILLFLLLFLPSLAFGQLYGTGVGYVNGTPAHTPNIAQKGSELCVSINHKMLYLWNRDSSEWKPLGGITVTFGAPIAAPSSSGGTRTAINMQTGLIFWWNGSAWKELISYSVELASAYAAAVAELYANQVRDEVADSMVVAREYADSLHLADNDRDSTNELQNLVLLGMVLNITDGNAVDFAGLFANYLLKSDSTTVYATRYYTRTNPTTIAANAVPRSNGANLVAGNITDNASRILMGLPTQFKSYSMVGMPNLSDLDIVENSTTGFLTRYKTGVSENVITSTGASANQISYFTSSGQIAGNSRHTVDPATGSQTIAFNNSGGSASWYWNATSPVSSGGPFGIVYQSNNQIRFGLLGGAQITFTGAGAQAIFSGLWNFPSANYSAPLALGANNSSGDDVRLILSKSGNGANQFLYLTAQRYAANGQQPHLGIAATSHIWATRNAGSGWSNLADSSSMFLASNGDFWLGRRFWNGATFWNPPTTQARLNIVGRGTATTYPLILAENLGGNDRFVVRENGNVEIPTTPVNSSITGLLTRDATGTIGLATLSGLAYSGGVLTSQNIFNFSGALTGNRTIYSKGYSVLWDSIASFGLKATEHTSQIGNASFYQKKKLNLAGTKYFDAWYQYDSRSTIANGTNVNYGPSYSRLFVFSRGFGEEYEWTDLHVLDTTNGVFGHMYGSRYYGGFVSFRAQRPSSGSAYRLTPTFDFNVPLPGNSSAWSPHSTFRVGSDTLFQIKHNGLIEAKQMGTGAKTTAALGFTTPTHLSAWVPSGTGKGTLVDLPIALGLTMSGGSLRLLHKSLIDSLPLAPVTIDAQDNAFAIINLNSLYFQTNDGDGIIDLTNDIGTIATNTDLILQVAQGDARIVLSDDPAIRMEVTGANGAHPLIWDANKFLLGYRSPTQLDTTFRVDTDGTVQAPAYGTGGKQIAASPYVAAYSATGKLTEYRIVRDTLVTADNSFTVGTLLNTCQELHVTTSLSIFAPYDITATLPTPSATFRGKRVTVYNAGDASASYLLTIGVSGGASELYYTTNTSSSAPSDQASLSLDGSTWPHRGATYTFTCKLIGSNYRWVLEQR